MRVGLYFDLRNPPRWQRSWSHVYGRALELIEEAESLGAGSVWFTEHHLFEDGYLPQPLTFAAAAAARTRSVRLGTAVLLAPLRPAIQVAEEVAVVDVLSEGRVDLGVGAGYHRPEFEAYGVDVAGRHDRTDRRVREMRSLWSEGRVTPPPVQERVPIWLGYTGPRGAGRAGRLGESLLSLRSDLLEPYRQGLAEGGHPPERARMGGVAHMVLADDPERARERIAPHLAHQWDTYRRAMVEGTDREVPRPVDPHRWMRPGPRGERPRFEVLTAEEAVDSIRERCRDLPVTDVFVWADVAGMPDDLVERNVALVAGTLAPALASS